MELQDAHQLNHNDSIDPALSYMAVFFLFLCAFVV